MTVNGLLFQFLYMTLDEQIILPWFSLNFSIQKIRYLSDHSLKSEAPLDQFTNLQFVA